MLQRNFLKEKLSSQHPVIGSWITLPSPHMIEVIATAAPDFLILDREHGSLSYETVGTAMGICEQKGVSPLIRIPDLTVSEVQRALDLGAHGLHIPNIRTPSQIEELIAFAKYPPHGNRGFSPFIRAAGYTPNRGNELLEKANHNTLLIIHIEGEEALKNFERFLHFPQIDLIFIGLYDLSKSFAVSTDPCHPETEKILVELIERAHTLKKKIGTIAKDHLQLKKLLELGIDYITYSVDCEMLLTSYQTTVRFFHQELKEKAWN